MTNVKCNHLEDTHGNKFEQNRESMNDINCKDIKIVCITIGVISRVLRIHFLYKSHSFFNIYDTYYECRMDKFCNLYTRKCCYVVMTSYNSGLFKILLSLLPVYFGKKWVLNNSSTYFTFLSVSFRATKFFSHLMYFDVCLLKSLVCFIFDLLYPE